MLLIQLIYNLSILVASSIISGFIETKFNKETLTGKILQGLLFGTIAVIGMLNPLIIDKGVIFDGRSIMLSLCSLFFGPISACIACIMVILARLEIGGPGTLMGITVIIESTLIGLLFFYLQKNNKIKLNSFNIWLIGLIVHIFMIFSMILLPSDIRFNVFRQLSLPIIVYYPLGTLLIGKILIDQEKNTILTKKLQEEQIKLKTIQQNIPGMIYKANKNWKTEITTGSEKICKYDPEELKKTSWLEIVYDKDREKIINELKKISPKNNNIVQEYRIVDKDNTIRWISDHKTFIFDANKDILEIYGIVFDISDKIEKEQLMKTLTKAIEESPISVLITDAYGKIKYANTRYTEQTESTLKELLMTYPEILDPKQTSKEYFNMIECLKSGEIWIGEYKKLRKDGIEIWERATIFTIFNENKEIANFVLLIEDITDIKQLINELTIAKEKAEESDRLKSAFLANMSHEIRTPMNGIMGFAELLKNPNLTSTEKDKYIEMILKSGKRMLDTLNDIINISKIEAGIEKLNIKDVNINHLLEDIYNFYLPEAKSKGIEFYLHKFLPDNKAYIKSDDFKLHVIINNLIKNALKFTSNGQVDFGYWIENSSIIFYVKDTGKGISPSFQDKLFKRFVQEEIGYTRTYEGNGLGLAISKAYVEMLEGKIWLEKSEINKGSEFRFKIPYLSDNNTSSKITIIEDDSKLITTKDLNLLIAEDDDFSYEYFEILFRNQFNKIFRAHNGQEAINIVKQNKIDLILMDIKMPLMDGYEATKKIREFNKEIIIIAQTAFAYPEDEIKAYKSGCNGYISKPINKNDLIKLINTLLKIKTTK